MSNTFCYSAHVDGADYPVEFGYDESGLLDYLCLGSLFGGFKLTPFGEDGSKLEIDYYVPIGILGNSWTAYLVFNKAINFTQPLSLDQFSTADSSYVFTPAYPDKEPSKTLSVQAVTAITCPPKPEI